MVLKRIVQAREHSETSINNVLVPGSSEYIKTRYKIGYHSSGKPNWLKRLEWQKSKRDDGEWVYRKGRDGNPGKHFAETVFIRELSECISRGLDYKTKTFYYKAFTGEIFINDKYVGVYDKKIGALSKFTLKFIDTKLSRYRLRNFGVNLVSLKGKTYWRMKVYPPLYSFLKIKYDNISESFKQAFPSMQITDNVFLCELRNNVVYEREGFTSETGDIEFRFTTLDTHMEKSNEKFVLSYEQAFPRTVVLKSRTQVDDFIDQLTSERLRISVSIDNDKQKMSFEDSEIFLLNLTNLQNSSWHGRVKSETGSLYRDSLIGVPLVLHRENKEPSF